MEVNMSDGKNIMDIAEGLVQFCRKGQFRDAIDRYYSFDIVSVEAIELPALGKEQRGIEAIRGKDAWWADNNEIHSVTANGPFLGAGRYANQFAVHFLLDLTPKSTGKRVTFAEMGLYTVGDGRIVREEFYYPGA
jgi:SnoaL-like domain